MEQVKVQRQTVVLYHRGCNDGMVAAWAAWKKFGPSSDSNPVVYLPYQYGEEFPEVCFGAHVIMVDLSLKVEQLSEAFMQFESLLVIDHHKSAEPLLEHMASVLTYDEYIRTRAVKPLTIYFNRDYSGAVLSYAFFSNLQEIVLDELPLAIQMIHDYDTWQFKLENTKAINIWFINRVQTLQEVDDFIDIGPTFAWVEIGRTLIRYDERIARGVIKQYTRSHVMPDGSRVAFVNGPHHLRNEISDQLLKSGDFDVAVVFTHRKERSVFSLRSNPGFNVAEIAETFGGGGHEQAAAYSIPLAPINVDNPLEPRRKTFRQRLSAAWKVLKGEALA